MPVLRRNRAQLGSSPPPESTKRSKLFHGSGPSDNDLASSDQVASGSSGTGNPTDPMPFAAGSSEDVGNSAQDEPKIHEDIVADAPSDPLVPVLVPHVAKENGNGPDEEDDVATVFSEVVGYEIFIRFVAIA